jgi:hypothetical protein
MSRQLKAVVAIMLALVTACRDERPAAGYAFAIELPPGEGIPVLEAVSDTLTLRSGPRTEAPTTGQVGGVKGTITEHDSVRYITMRPGALVAVTASIIEGRDLGVVRLLSRAAYYEMPMPRDSFEFSPGDTIEFLQHRAEGSCFVRLGERVIDARRCPAIDPTTWTTLREPETELWFRLVVNGSAGWVPVSDSTIRIARRTF